MDLNCFCEKIVNTSVKVMEKKIVVFVFLVFDRPRYSWQSEECDLQPFSNYG